MPIPIQENPELFLDELRLWLALYHDIQISTTALYDNLRQLGLTRKIICRAAAERDHELRANWMYDILESRMEGHSSVNMGVLRLVMILSLLYLWTGECTIAFYQLLPLTVILPCELLKAQSMERSFLNLLSTIWYVFEVR